MQIYKNQMQYDVYWFGQIKIIIMFIWNLIEFLWVLTIIYFARRIWLAYNLSITKLLKNLLR